MADEPLHPSDDTFTSPQQHHKTPPNTQNTSLAGQQAGGQPAQHEYGPALAGTHWQAIYPENVPAGQILSLLDFTFSIGVNISDNSTSPGRLWEASIENTCAIPGCVDLTWAVHDCQACVVILWDSGWYWKAFQESTGFAKMAPLVSRDIVNRSILVLDRLRLVSYEGHIPWRVEVTFEAGLEADTRLKFEIQVSHILEHLFSEGSQAFTCGWAEHDAPTRADATEEDMARVKT
ncbi:hypothetical protein NLG97_g8686 [Lecanicillium saksenae]|uniref:Uncharacterized protein n=1 Tax=Lecanicillium saksenae TaxID=468837 RepID=A0ACC1QI64_9HYPO|nr:hypothetical protein NLG97_g8686 [Lecanicillium saksenae]